MFKAQKETGRIANYKLMVETAKSFLEGETDLIAALANISALIKFYVDDINWAGFYLLKGNELVLGPFQGLPACVRIGEGKGVCGRAVLDAKPVIVPDVRLFSGHIACDSQSLSEIVIPFFRAKKVCGVLDADSPLPGRFTELEKEYLSQITEMLNSFMDAS
ncbi:MAG: GAF domain-containing protein [Treponema sp.]|nr:GAF domain-containing protein [Treponema sp.]